MVYPEPVTTEPTETTTTDNTTTDNTQTSTDTATTEVSETGTDSVSGTEAATTDTTVVVDTTPTVTSANVTGTVFYKDGVNKIPVATMQAIDQNDQGIFEQPISEGIYKIENLNADEFMLNVLINGTSVGSVKIVLVLGDNVQDITTN